MRVMEGAINWDDVATMNEVCALVGIEPPPVRKWVDELDFDPDALIAQIEALHSEPSSAVRWWESPD